MRKLRFLYLANNDTPLDGHAWSAYSQLPEDRFEKRIVVFMSSNGLAPSFISNRFLRKVVFRLLPLYRKYYALCRYHIILQLNRKDAGLYSYYQNEFIPDLSSWIMRKIRGYKPDVIVVCWSANFLTSKTIHNLHEKTGAWIHFSFVDEQHMTGGCHYPSGCEGYRSDCGNCPALSSGKLFAHYSLANKLKNLKGLPISVSASEYDGKLARQSALFRDAMIFTSTAVPKVTEYDKVESRSQWGVCTNDYVVFFACSNLGSKRKGAEYAIEAVRSYSCQCDHLTLLVAGAFNDNEKKLFDGINAVFTGYLNREDMFRAFCASDVFLSTTVADSGPMMVNFAIALGIPVVAFPVGVADTLVKTGKTGYLAKFKDVNDLVKGLQYIYSLNKQEYENMRKNCQKAFDDIDTTPWYDKLEKYLRQKDEAED